MAAIDIDPNKIPKRDNPPDDRLGEVAKDNEESLLIIRQ